MSTIKIKVEELRELLKVIGEDKGWIEVELGKDWITLKNLPELSDWVFTAESVKVEQTEGILKKVEPGNWNGLAWMIEAVWRAAQISPAVIFQSGLFWKVIERVYQEKATPEHAILTRLGEIRYSEWGWKETDEDLTQILNNVWKSLNGKTLTELSIKIYGKG